MSIILLSALILSNILIAGQRSFEGFEDTNKKTTMNKDTSTSNNEDSGKNKSKNSSMKKMPTSNVGKLSTDIISDGTELMESTISATENEMTPFTTDEAFEVGMENGTKKNYRVDYASTIEDAYGQLNEVLGSDGIKRLTDDTKNLLKQQLQLADAMKSMGPLINNMAPLIEQTKGLMNGFGGKNLGNFASSVKSFTPSSSPSSFPSSPVI